MGRPGGALSKYAKLMGGHFQVGGRFENLLSFFKMAGPPSQVIDDQPRHKFYFFFMNTRFNDNKTLENSDVLSSRIAQHSHENNYIDAKQPVFLRWLRMRLRALFERKIWSEVQTWSGSSRTLCKTRALRAL